MIKGDPIGGEGVFFLNLSYKEKSMKLKMIVGKIRNNLKKYIKSEKIKRLKK